MLTILYPELLPSIHGLPVGLLALQLGDGSRPKLAVKASKEILLAAKMNLGFKVYVVPLVLGGKHTIALISAFFDDEDEPLVIRTPMFDESSSGDLRQTLLSTPIDVYFFDFNNRELLGFVADIEIPPHSQDLLRGASLLPFDVGFTKFAHDYMPTWFGTRSADDDRSAISVRFRKSLIPEDLLLLDLRSETHSYQGSPFFSTSQLIREEPGSFQEHDIVQLLHRVFSPEQIYLSPLRLTDREEVTDILVITNSRALFIQAKDSPNTERVLLNSLKRKRAAAKKSLGKAPYVRYRVPSATQPRQRP